MEQRHSERVSASSDRNSSRVHFLSTRSNVIHKLTSFKRVVLPVAAVSSVFLFGIGHAAFAATTGASIAVKAMAVSSSIAPPGTGPLWWLGGQLIHHIPTPHNPFVPFLDLYENIRNFFHNLPHTIGILSIDLMELLYKLASALLLKTPTWIFDNDWFKNTTLTFSAGAIGITSILTVLEGIKRMLSGLKNKRGQKLFKFIKTEPMDIWTIGKRWGLASLGMLSAPWAFKEAFKGLNWVSDKLISMNVNLMDASKLTHIDWFNVVTMGVFDVVLISTLIPTLWANGRRFFDLLVLAMISPLALTAWVFDSYRAFYTTWWNNVKKLSVVQIYHALFLLVIGWFIFGLSTPTDPMGLIVKLLVVVGGFARMQNPPNLFGINSKMHPNNVVHMPKSGDIQGGITKGFKDSKKKLSGPIGLAEKFVGKSFITTPAGWVASKAINLVPPMMRVKK